MRRFSPRLLALLFLATALVACQGEPETAVPTEAAPAATSSVEPRSTGSFTVVESDEPCVGGRCISFVASCTDLAEDAAGRLIIDDPADDARGTIVMFSGGRGTFFVPQISDDGTVPEMRRVINELVDAGFRVVQVAWNDGWTTGAPERNEGLGKLACRPATAAAWIADNLTDEGTAMCATGGSGGAAQTSYLLSHYGLEDRLSLAVPFAGNWMGHIDVGCLDDDPLNDLLHYSEGARRFMDASLGYEPGSGPCTTRDESARAVFEEASIAGGGSDYSHPETMVWIIQGGGDDIGALSQGHAYFERLASEGSPLLRIDIIPGAPHGLARMPEVADRIRDVMLRECRPR